MHIDLMYIYIYIFIALQNVKNEFKNFNFAGILMTIGIMDTIRKYIDANGMMIV